MKKIVETVEGEGLEGLLGECVVVWCMNYIYSGTLVGVNDTCIRLDDAVVVYETGDLDAVAFSNAQKLPKPLYVQHASIESFYAR